MPIKSVNIRWLGPFENIHLDFDAQANVLIGPNNCGKTSVLLALAEACLNHFSVPERFYHDEKRPEVRTTLWDESMYCEHPLPHRVMSKDVRFMKEIGYADFIPALRENTAFRPKSPLGKGTDEGGGSGIDRRLSAMDEHYLEPEDTARFSKKSLLFLEKQKSDATKEDEEELEKRSTWLCRPSRITDQAIVSKIVELDYRAYRKNESKYRKVISTVAGIASEITTGFPVAFNHIGEDERGLFPEFDTPDGKLPMDKLSQGTQSILQYLYHFIIGMAEYYSFPEDLTNRKAVFIVDEIDAHMHPEWQRRIIPTLTNNLPNCQLFASTHSPLILSGLKEGQVHLLSRGKGNEVVSTTNESDIRGWSADEILQYFMGMKGTLDIETEKAVGKLAVLRDKTKLSKSEKKELENLRKEVHDRFVTKRGKSNITSDQN